MHTEMQRAQNWKFNYKTRDGDGKRINIVRKDLSRWSHDDGDDDDGDESFI